MCNCQFLISNLESNMVNTKLDNYVGFAISFLKMIDFNCVFWLMVNL